MPDSDCRQQKMIRASRLSIFGNAFLSVLKIVVGIFAGSMAVVADGIDSLSDVLSSIITLITARIIARPPNSRHPYGYTRADTIASKLVAFMMFYAGSQLAMSTLHRLIENKPAEIPSITAIIVILISVAGKLFLAKYLGRTGKSIDSPMLLANARNMQNDVIISLSVLLGLLLMYVFKMPILDLITAFAVSLWIMYVSVKIFIASSRELMDSVEDPIIYKKIVDAVAKVNEAQNPHRIRARKMAHYFMIALDIEVDGETSIDEAHSICHQVEEQIRLAIPTTYDVVVHVEPKGDLNPKEVFGISGKDV